MARKSEDGNMPPRKSRKLNHTSSPASRPAQMNDKTSQSGDRDPRICLSSILCSAPIPISSFIRKKLAKSGPQRKIFATWADLVPKQSSDTPSTQRSMDVESFVTELRNQLEKVQQQEVDSGGHRAIRCMSQDGVMTPMDQPKPFIVTIRVIPRKEWNDEALMLICRRNGNFETTPVGSTASFSAERSLETQAEVPPDPKVDVRPTEPVRAIPSLQRLESKVNSKLARDEVVMLDAKAKMAEVGNEAASEELWST